MTRINKTMKKELISAPRVLKEPIKYSKPVPFSRGVKVKLGEYSILFISGTASIDSKGKTIHVGNFLAQAERTFMNLTALLKSTGVTWQDVIKTTVFLKSMKDYDMFNKFRIEFYKKQGVNFFPASTCVEANLCRPDLLLEVEIIAIIKE